MCLQEAVLVEQIKTSTVLLALVTCMNTASLFLTKIEFVLAVSEKYV